MTVLVEKHVGYRQLSLNRPDRLNALNTEMFHALMAALAEAEADPDVPGILVDRRRARVLRRAGPRRRAVGDDGPPDLKAVLERYNALVRTLRALEMPVVCAVNGVAAGAGANLALACDIVLAAKSANFHPGVFPDRPHSRLRRHLVPAAAGRGGAGAGAGDPRRAAAG